MSVIGFEKDFLPERVRGINPDRVCWNARKILAGYMLEGEDLEVEGVSLDNDSPWPIVHLTDHVRIGYDRFAHLSNRPFIMDDNGNLQPYTLPGYVAVHIEPDDLEEYDYAPSSAAYCDQLIFQVPFHNSHAAEVHAVDFEPEILLGEAAIYHGFSFDQKKRIDGSDKKVRAAKKFLDNLDHGLFLIMTHEGGAWQGTYLSQTPECGVDEELESGFLESGN